MAIYAARRVVQAVVLLFIVSVVTFALIHAAPGGPAMLANPDLSKDQIEQMSEQLQLDDPLPVQYGRWLRDVLRGDLGTSYNSIEPVTKVLRERLPNTLLLAGVAFSLAVVLSIPLGVFCALRSNSAVDRLVAGFTFLGISVPVFWLGIMLIVAFSLKLHWLPAGGMSTTGEPFSLADRLKHLAMPASVLMIGNLAELTRYTRSGMLSVLHEDYMRTARAKGLAGRVVVIRHGLRNALIPVITVVGAMLPRAVGGAAVTEAVFSWPGMGRLAVEAAGTRDYPVVLGTTLTVAAVVVVSSLVTDLLYGYLDPRIRLG